MSRWWSWGLNRAYGNPMSFHLLNLSTVNTALPGFPGVQGLRILLAMQGTQVLSLVRELRFPRGAHTPQLADPYSAVKDPTHNS